MIKYGLIVLHADDHRNGGAFALYAQLKRGIDEAIAVKRGMQTAAVSQPTATVSQPTAVSTAETIDKAAIPADNTPQVGPQAPLEHAGSAQQPIAVKSGGEELLPSDLALATYNEDRARATQMMGNIFRSTWNPTGWRSRIQVNWLLRNSCMCLSSFVAEQLHILLL